MNELQMFLQALKQPEYRHVLLNPVPMYGLAMGLLALVLALLLKSRPARVVAMVLIAVACASVWPVVRSGHAGYDRVTAMSNADAKQWLDVHQHRADRVKYVFYLTGLLALAALIAEWKFPKTAIPLALATMVLVSVGLCLGGWVAHAGGKVRHTEFREGPPPHPVEQQKPKADKALTLVNLISTGQQLLDQVVVPRDTNEEAAVATCLPHIDLTGRTVTADDRTIRPSNMPPSPRRESNRLCQSPWG